MQHLGHLLAVGLLNTISFLFAVGGIGCAAVLVMTFWEDVKTVTGH